MRHPLARAPFLFSLVAFLLLPPLALEAQTRLSEPASVFPQDFGSIQTVRELPDGRVLVADPLGKALYVVDMETGERTVLGREGQGPEEYRQPDAVWPLPGDSTLLVDLGNGRTVALGPDLTFGPTWPIHRGDFQPGQPLVLALPQGVDGEGNVYARQMGGGLGGGAYPDSANILRIDRDSGASEPAGNFKLQSVTQTTSGGANNQQVAISPIPLSPQDPWGVAPDGSVFIVRSGDYHVERIAPDGAVIRGPAVPFDALDIGTAEKEEWVAENGRSGGGIGIGVSMVNGAMSMTFSRGGQSTQRREIDNYTWPEEKPPVYGGRIPVDLLGRAWVRRHVEAGEPSTYDVFDGSCNRVGTVLLEPGKRIIGFGSNTVYVVSYDEFDLNYLEKHLMPGF
jgi:hypothetical protein